MLNKTLHYLCLLALAVLIFYPDEAVKVFTVASALAFFLIARDYKSLLPNKSLLILPVLLLAFGLLQMIWVAIYKQSVNEFTAAYRSYQNAGKLMIFSALIVYALQTTARPTKAGLHKILYIIIGLSLITCIYAFYQKFTYPADFRVTLGLERATGTAYTMSGIALLGSQAILSLRFKCRDLLFIAHFILTLTAIIFTQTRAAILVFPVLNMVLFIIHHWRDKKLLSFWMTIFIIVGGITFIPFKDKLLNRFERVAYEVNKYSNDDSNTSVGARLAMQKTGLLSGLEAPWGQSLELRSKHIKGLTKQEPMLSGALRFLNVHLHNEMIDTFSLKGILGVTMLISLYYMLLYTAIRLRSGIFLVISTSIAVYGLSDVVLYAKAEALGCMLFLCISLMLQPVLKSQA
ncbi:O-antigen ligase family protein [[Pantoea] beijingensis]|nr:MULTISPECIES: O-antigen ligase family protein [Erwiniaceae]